MPFEMPTTKEELELLIQSESDKRVTGALETQKAKFEKTLAETIATTKTETIREIEQNANLTAEEKAKKALDEQIKTLTEREKATNKRNNRLDAIEICQGAKIPKEHYDKFLDTLVTDDAVVTKQNIEGFVAMFNATKTTLETELKAQLTQVPPPDNNGGGGGITKEQFAKMTYTEKAKLKAENPELYQTFIKE